MQIVEYKKYKTQRHSVKNLVKLVKHQNWENFGHDMETNFKENKRLFYKTLQIINRDQSNAVTHIKNKEGTIITDEEQLTRRWK